MRLEEVLSHDSLNRGLHFLERYLLLSVEEHGADGVDSFEDLKQVPILERQLKTWLASFGEILEALISWGLDGTALHRTALGGTEKPPRRHDLR